MCDSTETLATEPTTIPAAAPAERLLRKELGLWDLVLAQVLCVVGSSWVGVAARLGKAHVFFWLLTMLLFYLPLAAVVIYMNRILPLEGGLYRWARSAFGDFAGFLTAWNLWVYAVVCVATILFVLPTDIAYLAGERAAWLPGSKLATILLICLAVAAIAVVAIRGLSFGKWLHNIGSLCILLAYGVLLLLPVWALVSGRIQTFQAFPWQMPAASWLSVAVFGQMTVGALSGFEYVAIMAGECHSASRTIGRSVLISAPVIALMFILGTSTVLAFVGGNSINLIGPIPQTFRAALGSTGAGQYLAPFAIFLVLARAVACASLIFTGLTRLPMTAGWDHLLPGWFTSLHKRWQTPVHAILFVAVLVVMAAVCSLLGTREQEAMQLLQNASTVHYGIAYIMLFAIPLWGSPALRSMLPGWLKAAAAAGFLSSVVAVVIAIHPIIDVPNPLSYALKIALVVLGTNLIAVLIFRANQAERTLPHG